MSHRSACSGGLLVLMAWAFAAALQPMLASQSRTPSPAQPPARQAAPLAIKGGTVFTITTGTIPNGTVVVRDGKIAAVGANVPVPAGAEVVDATGRFVTPGLIDQHSHIGGGVFNEGGTSVSSMTRIDDVLDATDVNIYRDLAGGITLACIFHGSANPIDGTNTLIKLRWGKTLPEDLVFDGARPGLKFALGENPKDKALMQNRPGPRRYPASRPGVEFVLRDAFTRARAYQRAWQDYERRKKAGEDVIPPRRDLQLDPLVEVLEGKRLAHVHAYRADEILMMLRFAEEFGFKVATFEHGLEGYKVAKELAAHGAGIAVFADRWGDKVETIDSIPYNAALLLRNGVLVSLHSDSAEYARRMNTEAAKTIKWGGLTEDEALSLVTINPAKQLRIEKRVGSIEVGKDADLVIWNKHPLSSYAVVDRAYIDGTVYYDREADLQRVAEAQKEKEALIAAEQGGRRTRPTDDAPAPPGGHGGSALSDQLGVAAQANLPLPAAPDASNGHNGPPEDARQAASRGTVARAQDPAALAITNARIFPVTRPAIERGTILIRNGRIEAVGASVPIPADAKVVDAAGGEVYPGWINARTTLGLAEPGPRGYQDTEEMLDYNPQLRTVVAYHNDSDAIPVARANGITTVAVFPTGGLLGGQVPVMNLDGWTWEESAVQPAAGISFQFPPIRAARAFGFGAPPGPERTYEELKKERDARLDDLARLLDQARAYAKAGPDRQVDWVLQALVPVVERTLPLYTTTATAEDVVDALAFADRVGVRLVICGGPDVAGAARVLKEKSVPVILGPVLVLPSSDDASHAASFTAAAALAREGVKFAFATSDTTNVRQLPYHAAMSVAWGLSRDDALKALTINAAEILGVGDRLGSIEPGKIANLVVSKGDPLEARTEVTHVIINGQDVSLDNKQLGLYQRYMKRR